MALPRALSSGFAMCTKLESSSIRFLYYWRLSEIGHSCRSDAIMLHSGWARASLSANLAEQEQFV
jgi:hypothetical protein